MQISIVERLNIMCFNPLFLNTVTRQRTDNESRLSCIFHLDHGMNGRPTEIVKKETNKTIKHESL